MLSAKRKTDDVMIGYLLSLLVIVAWYLVVIIHQRKRVVSIRHWARRSIYSTYQAGMDAATCHTSTTTANIIQVGIKLLTELARHIANDLAVIEAEFESFAARRYSTRACRTVSSRFGTARARAVPFRRDLV